MKLNKIKGLCKKRNTVYLYERRNGSQLISDGAGLWPVTEELRLSEDALQTIFEIPNKAWNENWRHEHIVFGEDDTSKGFEHLLDEIWEASAEVQTEPVKGKVELDGCVFRAFRADDGLTVFVPDAQLETMTDDAQYYMLRQGRGFSVLAVYDSLLMCGLVGVADAGTAEMIRTQCLDWGNSSGGVTHV